MYLFSISLLYSRTYVEAGHDYDHTSVPDGKILTDMFNKSPISHIDKVKAPTLMLVGKTDRRVPPSQGINYYKKLLARGIPTKYVNSIIFVNYYFHCKEKYGFRLKFL